MLRGATGPERNSPFRRIELETRLPDATGALQFFFETELPKNAQAAKKTLHTPMELPGKIAHGHPMQGSAPTLFPFHSGYPLQQQRPAGDRFAEQELVSVVLFAQ